MGAERPGGVNDRREGDAPEPEGDARPADVVDFDALHAALGDLPPPPPSSTPILSESQGRANATYASARPRPVPSTRPPAVDLDAPAVIVAPEDTAPLGLQRKTAPLGGVARPRASNAPPAHAGVSSVPTPDRVPMPTVVVRVRRGPTRQQKLLVFMAMLLVFVSGGLAFLIYGKELGVDLAPEPPRAPVSVTGATAVAPAPTETAAAPITTPSAVVEAPAPTASAPSPSASARPAKKPRSSR